MSKNGNGLLEYIPGSQALLVQKNSSPPLEGFTENIRDSVVIDSGQHSFKNREITERIKQ